MNFQTSDSSSKGVPSGSRPSQRATLGQVGRLADRQPQSSAGLKRAKRGNPPSHEYAAQSSGPVANNFLGSLAIASDDASGVSAASYSKSPSKGKVARPAPLVQRSPSPSPPPSRKAFTPSPAKVTGKRRSSSQEPAGPSSPSKRARRMKEKDIRVDASAVAESSFGMLAISQPVTVRAATPQPQSTPGETTNPDSVPDLGSAVPMLRTRRQYKAASQYAPPRENGDNTATDFVSDRPITRGGREKRADATMARRIAEVQRLKERWEYLMDRLNSEERLADPAADDTLEDDMAEATAARKAWKDAERELISPSSTPSPESPSQAPPSLPTPAPIEADHDTPSMIVRMRKPYGVLFRYLDAVLPELPPASTIIGPPSASLPALAPPTPANAVASTSGATPTAAASTTTTFRFSPNEEAGLLELASEQKYRLAIEMIPANQQRLVLKTPSEIAAVREIHARPKTRRTNNDGTRKVKTHIGEDGVETELWVCRALFKVHKGCGGIEYLESPCGYPVGTKDSWIRHLKDVHLGRVNRGA